MHSRKHIYRISLVGRGPQGSLKSNSLFLFLPLSEPPVHLRPNLHPPEEMFGCLQHTPVPFPHSYFCCSSWNPGTGLERMQVLHCQLQSRNSHFGIMSLHYSTEQPNSAGMESGIKLSLASTEAKSGQSREQSTLEHFTCKVFWPSAVYGSASSLSGCRVWGWGWNWLYSDSLFP